MRRSTPAFVTILALIVAILAACGGGAATTVPSTAPSTAPSSSASAAPSTGASVAPSAAASATRASTGTVSGGATATRAATGAAATATRTASPGAGAPAPRVTGALTIFAAASLTDAVNEMKGRIEAANPGTTLTFNYAASSALRTQLEQGAKADLYVSADTLQMENATKSGIINGGSNLFVRNTPVIIVPANNPKGIAAPADLAKSGIKLVLAAPAVPIGNYSRQIFDKMNADPAYGADFRTRALANLVSEEANVRQVVAKVQLGEGDAGIVYSSDVTPAVRDQVRIIAIPASVNVVAEYPVALVKGAANEAGARAFIGYLLSAEGQAILQKWGFIPIGSATDSSVTIVRRADR